jgi:peroxin-5
MSLAVSYTNESLQTQACNTLKDWLRYNPQYSHLVPPEQAEAAQRHAMSSFMPSALHNEIRDLYIAAVQSNKTDNIDADVQVLSKFVY